jgi:hypothetical protein
LLALVAGVSGGNRNVERVHLDNIRRLSLSKLILAASILVSVASQVFASSILIVNGDGQPEVAMNSTNVSSLETGLGNTVTFASTVPGGLAGYTAVFDLRFDNFYALTSADVTSYDNYLIGGGSLYLTGENGNFAQRNNSIFSLINGLGGGTFSFVPGCAGFATDTQIQAATAPFNGPNPVATGPLYNCEGNFNNPGTGQFVTTVAPFYAQGKNSGHPFGAGVAFAPGTLPGAPDGRLVSVLDSDFMIDLPLFYPGDSRAIASQDLVENLVDYVNLGGTTSPVPQPTPEPGSAVLVAAALGLCVLLKRRHQSPLNGGPL